MSGYSGRIFLAAIFLILTGSMTYAASGNKTKKLTELTSGQVVKIGGVSFVKTADNQLIATSLCPEGSSYSSYFKGCVVKTTTFAYTGNYQTFTAPVTGPYVVELWGASGGRREKKPADGGYVSGYLDMSSGENYYLYVGQNRSTLNGGAFNASVGSTGNGVPGGGATDIRLNPGAWNDAQSLNSRIAVAAGAGAGSYDYNDITGYAGGLVGYSASSSKTGGTQIGAGTGTDYSCDNYADTQSKFGIAASCGASGGGGFYAGSSGAYATGGGAGGSSYISGHTGCVAIAKGSLTEPREIKIGGCTIGTTNNVCSIHYSGKYFTNTVMIDGAGYNWTNVKGELTPMPDPASVGSYYASGVGHTGNGAARITQLSAYLGI